jgi:hypothetical protein
VLVEVAAVVLQVALLVVAVEVAVELLSLLM